MASKDEMLSRANYYASLVATAGEKTGNAVHAMTNPIDEVGISWDGRAGNAMGIALIELRNEMSQIHSRLISLESRMRSHARYVYNTWPEESLPEDGDGAFGGGGGGSR